LLTGAGWKDGEGDGVSGEDLPELLAYEPSECELPELVETGYG